MGLLEAALARPLNRAAYREGDAFDFAAAYAFGIARNPPFREGNKRVALVVAELFLMKNRHVLEASDVDCVLRTLALADGSLSEDGFAHWLRANSVPYTE